MKLHTITMTVHHGDYRNTETAQGVSCEAALLEILKTPMGIGYGPNPDTRPAQFEAIAKTLKESGFMQWGWADYSLTMDEPSVCGPSAGQCDDILGKAHYSEHRR